MDQSNTAIYDNMDTDVNALIFNEKTPSEFRANTQEAKS